MLYIYTALYLEAKPFIEYFKLKRDLNESNYQIFYNDQIVLIIGGVGLIKSAISCTYMLTKYHAGNKDFVVNVGLAGSASKSLGPGSVILCNKIVDVNKNNYYPDIMYRHDFIEGSLYTSVDVVKSLNSINLNEIILLCDMEGASIYNSAKLFVPPHKICILKVVSDYIIQDDNIKTNANVFNRDDLLKIMNKNIKKIYDILEFFLSYKENDIITFSEYERELMNKISNNMKLTKSMMIEFEKLARYYRINNNNLEELLKKYTDIYSLTKDEVRKNFGKLKRELVQ